jgi:glycosyltransferase involved in cell wall biosynthesis
MNQRYGGPAICVVIPAFNPGDHLGKALESVFGQSITPIETVVIDDGSDQDLSWIEATYPNVRLIRQRRAGPSVARNRGIFATSAELIAFMDQDDLWSPEKLARQVDAMLLEPRAGLCYCDVVPFTGEQPPKQVGEYTDPILYLSEESPGSSAAILRSIKYFADRFVVPSSVMLRREVLSSSGLLDPILPFSGDFDLLIRIGATYPVIHLPAPLVYYRRHQNSFSHDYDVGRFEVRALIARYVAYGRWRGDREFSRSAASSLKRPRALYASQAFDCARLAYRDHKLTSAVYHMSRATLFNPAFIVGVLARHIRNRVGRTVVSQ